MAFCKGEAYELFLVVLLCAAATVTYGRGINIGICGTENMECRCGTPGYRHQVPVKQCTYFYKFRNLCKPCHDITQHSFCPKFLDCAQCDKNGCTKCPPNKFGNTCSLSCTCQNGGKCNEIDGSCACPPTYQGTSCEIRNITECPPIESVANLVWSSLSNKVGDAITATCADGYLLIGEKVRICNKQGEWSTVAPYCETSCSLPKISGHLQAVINPGLASKLVDANGQEVIKEIGFMCEPGYSLRGPIRTRCQSSGKWDQEPPACEPKFLCPEPARVANGHVKILGAPLEALVPGTQLKITCNDTHFLDGPAVISCTAAGTWSSSLPRCLKKFGCPPPTMISNGKVEITKPVTTTTSKPSQKRSRIGLPTKRGRNVKLVRVATTASPLSPPPGFSDTNSRALYTCKSAFYRLIGTPIRVCLSNGQWSGTAPKCEALCGKAGDTKRPSIINGTASSVGRWPWQAGISTREKEEPAYAVQCGGSLVSERLVVTAAHCVTYTPTTVLRPASHIRVYLGKHFRYLEFDDPEVIVMAVESVILHPNYHPINKDSDIALIKLLHPVEFNHRISPICLPKAGKRKPIDELPENSIGTAIGWGIHENNSESEELREVVLPVVSNEKCQNDYNSVNANFTITVNMFCAGPKEGGFGTCNGDSGGPFMIESGSGQDAIWTQEGIVSFGGKEKCAVEKLYSGFLKLFNFVEWIEQNM